MKRILLAFLIVACTHHDDQPKDWRWAFGQYGTAACQWYYRCFAGDATQEFGKQEDGVCADVEGDQCYTVFGDAQCVTLFPKDRYDGLDQCMSDYVHMDCNSFFAPDSCVNALTP